LAQDWEKKTRIKGKKGKKSAWGGGGRKGMSGNQKNEEKGGNRVEPIQKGPWGWGKLTGGKSLGGEKILGLNKNRKNLGDSCNRNVRELDTAQVGEGQEGHTPRGEATGTTKSFF